MNEQPHYTEIDGIPRPTATTRCDVATVEIWNDRQPWLRTVLAHIPPVEFTDRVKVYEDAPEFQGHRGLLVCVDGRPVAKLLAPIPPLPPSLKCNER